MPEKKQAAKQQESKEEILKERALKLAKSKTVSFRNENALEALLFNLAGGIYAIESKFIKEVHRLKDLTPLPSTPAHILGLVNIRRKIVTLVDLQILFGLPKQDTAEEKKILVVAKDDIEFAILIDELLGVNSISLQDIEFSLSEFTEQGEAYLKGVTTNGIAILDGDKLIRSPKLIVDNSME